MLDKLKNINKLFIIIPLIVLIIILLVVMVIQNFKVSNVERIKITEISDKANPYFDDLISIKEEEGRYVVFAIDYLYDTKNKNSFNIDEVIETINEFFDISFTREDMIKLGLTPYMMNKGIEFDTVSGDIRYEYKKTRADVAATPIVKYELKEIKKNNKNKFTIIYDRLVVEDPYKLLNYYSNMDNPDDDLVKDLTSYVKGEIMPSKILKYINSNDIEKYGKNDGNKRVTYAVINDKIKIKKIE